MATPAHRVPPAPVEPRGDERPTVPESDTPPRRTAARGELPEPPPGLWRRTPKRYLRAGVVVLALAAMGCASPPRMTDAADVVVTIVGACYVIQGAALVPCAPSNCRVSDVQVALARWAGYPDSERDQRARAACRSAVRPWAPLP